MVFLSGFACWSPWHERCLLEFGGGVDGEFEASNFILYFKPTIPNSLSNSQVLEYTPTRRRHSSEPSAAEHIDNNANTSNCSSPALSPSVYIPIDYHSDSSNSSHQHSVRFHKLAEVRHLSSSHATEARHARLSYAASLQAELLAKRLASKLSIKETAGLSMTFCLLWFCGAWTYQLAISNTEAGVVNLLSSSSSLFTLILASLYPSSAGDLFSWSKLAAVVGSCGEIGRASCRERV